MITHPISESKEQEVSIRKVVGKVFISDNYITLCECGKKATMNHYAHIEGSGINHDERVVALCECGNVFITSLPKKNA